MHTFALSDAACPLTLSQFACAVGDSIRANPLTQGVWIVAELSDVRISGGHCYMELIEKDARGTTVAKMRAMIWASSLHPIRSKFLAATGQDIHSGMKMMVRGSATHHNVYGLSVQISDIDPSYTLGDMERLRREILARLQREGIIDDNRQYPLPPAPQRIAVVSAEGAAGYGDFMRQLDGNQFGFKFHTRLFPAVMQGERTSLSVRAALSEVERDASRWDCVAIVRGGGATSDLNGFDDYELARAVALFPLPVIVGIGHERDRTVLDEIAAIRLKTPTAAGAFLVDRLADAWRQASELARRAVDFASERMRGDRLRLSHIEASVPMLVKARISDAHLRLTRLANTLPAVASARIGRSLASLDSVPQLLRAAVASRLRAEDDSLARFSEVAAAASEQRIRDAGERLAAMETLVGVLNPEATLKRGYSITRLDGKAVRDASLLRTGQKITTLFSSGTVISEIK